MTVKADESTGGKKKDKPKALSKIIVRRLPPTMTEEQFLEQVSPVPDHDDFYFVPGDWTLGQNASARAYITFSNPDEIFIFKDKFDGYVFVDAKGAEFPAVVEYAPFQSLPKNRSRKKDTKVNTIESDTHFMSFLESLKTDENEKGEAKLEYSFQLKDEKKITSTPLLEFLAKQKLEQKEKKRKRDEDRKRQRWEERQKKRSQEGAGEPIKEEEKGKDDDGITVRVVPSRLDKSQRSRNRGKGAKDSAAAGDGAVVGENKEKERRGDRKKDRERNRDKEKAKREDKEKSRQDKQATKESPVVLTNVKQVDPEIPKDGSAKPEEKASEKPATSAKKEVKKYSERRKETRARAENRLAEKQTEGSESKKEVAKGKDEKGDVSTKAPDRPDYEKSISVESTTDSNNGRRAEVDKVDGGGSKERNRNIRNKDRPSIAIYQPGRRQMPAIVEKTKEKKSGNESERSTSDHGRVGRRSSSSVENRPDMKQPPRERHNSKPEEMPAKEEPKVVEQPADAVPAPPQEVE